MITLAGKFGLILIVARLLSLQGAVAVYMKVLVVAPESGIKVPAPALKFPPVPEVLVQLPPESSLVIKLNKSIGVALESHILIDPFTPEHCPKL
jgi:hypothetical protein